MRLVRRFEHVDLYQVHDNVRQEDIEEALALAKRVNEFISNIVYALRELAEKNSIRVRRLRLNLYSMCGHGVVRGVVEDAPSPSEYLPVVEAILDRLPLPDVTMNVSIMVRVRALEFDASLKYSIYRNGAPVREGELDVVRFSYYVENPWELAEFLLGELAIGEKGEWGAFVRLASGTWHELSRALNALSHYMVYHVVARYLRHLARGCGGQGRRGAVALLGLAYSVWEPSAGVEDIWRLMWDRSLREILRLLKPLIRRYSRHIARSIVVIAYYLGLASRAEIAEAARRFESYVEEALELILDSTRGLDPAVAFQEYAEALSTLLILLDEMRREADRQPPYRRAEIMSTLSYARYGIEEVALPILLALSEKVKTEKLQESFLKREDTALTILLAGLTGNGEPVYLIATRGLAIATREPARLKGVRYKRAGTCCGVILALPWFESGEVAEVAKRAEPVLDRMLRVGREPAKKGKLEELRELVTV